MACHTKLTYGLVTQEALFARETVRVPPNAESVTEVPVTLCDGDDRFAHAIQRHSKLAKI